MTARAVDRGAPRRSGLAAAAALAVAIVLSACGGLPDKPDGMMQMKYPLYDSVDSLTVDSDLIVRAEALKVSEGRTVGESDDDSTQFRNIELDVEDVMFSRLKDLPAPFIIEEIGWVATKSVADPDLPWLREGQRAILFIRLDQTTGTYSYVAPQGRILLNPDGSVKAGGDDHLKQIAALNALSLPQLEQAISTAAKRVTDNQVPKGDGMGDGVSR